MDPFDNLARWRNQVFNAVLSIILGLGALTAIPSSLMMMEGAGWSIALLSAIALVWLLALRLWRTLGYRWRVFHFIAIVLLSGAGQMMTVGYCSLIYLVAAPVLAALLLGTEAAVVTLLLGSATIFGIGYAGMSEVHVNGIAHDSTPEAVLITINYMFVAGIITLSCSFLLQRLARSLDQLVANARSVAEGKLELHAQCGDPPGRGGTLASVR